MQSSIKTISKGFIFLCLFSNCRKFIEVNAPVTSVNTGNVYINDATASAVLTGIYGNMSFQNNDQSLGYISSLYLFASLSADELTLYNLSNTTLLPFYRNDLTSKTNNGNFWGSIYSIIFVANSAIEGLNNSTGLTPSIKKQLMGEAKFIRAFCYFYLVNLNGDVPLVLTTDYVVNSLMPRKSKSEVFQQIIADLIDAQDLLSSEYLKADLLSVTTERVRPNKWVACALLSRAYLYSGDYENAERQASLVINNTSLYKLSPLTDVFKKNSTEAIWQLQPVRSGASANTGEGALFILPASGPNTSINPVYLSNKVVNSFEINDQRKAIWVGKVVPTTPGTTTYYFANKYKIGAVNTTTQEYIMVLRLAEQFLIRAEARAKQNNISGAQSDLNTVRARSGLSNSLAIDKTSLLNAILQERLVELFTEWGHRWFDLKRSDAIDAEMNTASMLKGGSWESYKALYPIPQNEININRNLTQNIGY